MPPEGISSGDSNQEVGHTFNDFKNELFAFELALNRELKLEGYEPEGRGIVEFYTGIPTDIFERALSGAQKMKRVRTVEDRVAQTSEFGGMPAGYREREMAEDKERVEKLNDVARALNVSKDPGVIGRAFAKGYSLITEANKNDFFDPSSDRYRIN